MRILKTREFKNDLKRLYKNQKRDLAQAIEAIINNPLIGDTKTADLQSYRVYKFRMNQQLTLLAYTFESNTITLTLITFGSHENFYRNLKRK